VIKGIFIKGICTNIIIDNYRKRYDTGVIINVEKLSDVKWFEQRFYGFFLTGS